jgi:hypothetical protein
MLRAEEPNTVKENEIEVVETSHPLLALSFHRGALTVSRARGCFFALQCALKLSENEKNVRWVPTGCQPVENQF